MSFVFQTSPLPGTRVLYFSCGFLSELAVGLAGWSQKLGCVVVLGLHFYLSVLFGLICILTDMKICENWNALLFSRVLFCSSHCCMQTVFKNNENPVRACSNTFRMLFVPLTLETEHLWCSTFFSFLILSFFFFCWECFFFFVCLYCLVF